MARWKALPEGLDPMVVQFVVELRRMKDDSGLILDQLAKRTGYSDSSWERYLGGRAMAPAGAVRALTGIVGADETAVMVLHQAAQDAWAATNSGEAGGTGVFDAASAAATGSTTAGSTDGATDDPTAAGYEETPVPATIAASHPAGRPHPRLRAVLNSVTSALTGAAVAVLLLQPWEHDPVAPTAAPVAPATSAAAPAHYTCTFTQTDGKWYAGNSTTDTELVQYDMAGPEVAEVQCLLKHAEISPGGIDGRFGPKTLHAVILAQLAHHLDVDGQVGPHTWAALRG